MTSIAEARKALAKLIERYEKNKHDAAWMGNERQTQDTLIRPFLHDVLGWNIEEDVLSEPPIGGKRMDYLVRYDNISRFIIEVKAPKYDLFDNDDAYEQAVGYGHSKDIQFAILTNFRQIVIIACLVQTRVIREAALAKIDVLNPADSDIEKMLWFSKKQWLAPSGENPLILAIAQRKLRTPVDKQLLQDMINWRDLLKTNLKKNSAKNKLNFDDEDAFMHAEEEIQKFIDRLVFICFCEDKEIFDKKLKSLMLDKQGRQFDKSGWLLGEIRALFQEYRKGPDSDLFDKSECDDFVIDDDKLLSILTDLCQPEGRLPYTFASIDADVLGRAYENFIGHLTTGKKHFKEKEDISKRKKEGIYYTPKYIVDYIVNHTVREYVKGKSFEEIKKVRIVDPACGSGSFLLRAFDVLIEECSNKLKRELSYSEKRDLMLNCIYGVDLDRRAVAIAKLNLALKLAERGQPLPMLRDNIKHGDSIIDDKQVAGYNAFVWKDEFPDILRGGGFDVIIGNPPYVPIELFSDNDKEYYFSRYKSPNRKFDTVILFIENGMSLLKRNGLLGFIVPLTWQTGENYVPFRKLIFSQFNLNYLVNLPFNVFSDAYVDTGILVLEKNKSEDHLICAYSYDKKTSIDRIDSIPYQRIKQKRVEADSEKRVFTNSFIYGILDKLKKDSIPLGMISDSCQGVVVSKFPLASTRVNDSYKKLLIKGRAKRYYLTLDETKYIDYRNAMTLYKYYSVPRIFVRRIVNRQDRLVAFSYNEALITKKDYNPFILTSKEFELEYILGLINSKLFSFIYVQSSALATKNDFRQTTLAELRKLPIKKTESQYQKKFAAGVKKLIEIEKALAETSNLHSDDKHNLERDARVIDKKIDQEVYTLYDLTSEEIKIIETTLKD